MGVIHQIVFFLWGLSLVHTKGYDKATVFKPRDTSLRYVQERNTQEKRDENGQLRQEPGGSYETVFSRRPIDDAKTSHVIYDINDQRKDVARKFIKLHPSRNKVSQKDDKVLNDSPSLQNDQFLCGNKKQCQCKYLDSKFSMGKRPEQKTLLVSCSRKHLSVFPTSLPKNSKIIYAVDNNIKEFCFDDLNQLHELERIDLRNNKIEKIWFRQRPVNKPIRLSSLWLSRNRIHNIDVLKNRAFESLERLSLAYNCLEDFPLRYFGALKKLTYLDISHGFLHLRDDAPFQRLSKLKTLNLSFNPTLRYSDFLSKQIFKGLNNLNTLSIQGIADKIDQEYPNEALANLTTLKVLEIDGLGHGAEFGPEMKNLRNLKKMVIGAGGNCYLKNLSDTFFMNVPTLTLVEFAGCTFIKVLPNVFSPLPSLHKYIVSFPKDKYTLSNAFEHLEGLQNKSLKELTITGFMNPFQTTCSILQAEHVRVIKHLEKLEALCLNYNFISYIDRKFFEHLPKSLKFLTLRGNKLLRFDDMWTNLKFLSNLTFVDFRDQAIFPTPPVMARPYPQNCSALDTFIEEIVSPQRYESNDQLDNYKHLYIPVLPKGSPFDIPNLAKIVCGLKHTMSPERKIGSVHRNHNGRSNFHLAGNESCDPNIEYCPPQSLKLVTASGFTEFGRMFFTQNLSSKNLCYLDFSGGYLFDCGKGKLPESVLVANLKDNNCNKLNSSFFPPANSLQYLFLQKNYLGPILAKDTAGEIFANVGKLKYLDLSYNGIFEVPPLIFKALRELKVLRLSENKLQIINIDFTYMPKLEYLDLSKNTIKWIGLQSRLTLDNLADSNHSTHRLKMDIHLNPLLCTCEGLDLIEWLMTTKVVLQFNESLKCRETEFGFETQMGLIKDRVESLRRHCMPNDKVIIASSLFCLLFLLVVSCAVAYNRRWQLIYAKNVWFVKVCGFRPMGKTSHQKYDAYIVYCEEDRDFALYKMLDELERKRCHKLCLEDRDFIPGTFNFNNITCAIQNSNITLFLMSPEALTNNELEYAIQMAQMEECMGQTKRDVTLLLCLKDIQHDKLSKDILALMRQGRFLEYPSGESEDVKQRFWDRLSAEIGHTRGSDQVTSDAPTE